jgi:mannitol-1-phosphate 5-dehydrogenase
MNLAVHFGAGNIGRGFIAPTLQANNYKVIFIDVNKNLIKQINDKGSYTVKSLDIYGSSEEKIENVEAIDLTDQEKVRNALFDADLITTSVGPKFVEGVYKQVAELKHSNLQTFIAFENMYRASTVASSKIKTSNKNLYIIDAVVDKIVPPQSTTSLNVLVESFGSIILDESCHHRPLDDSEIVSYKKYEDEFYKKLWLLNGLHLQLSYFGLSKGNTYIHEVISSPEGRRFSEDAIKSLSIAYSLLSNTEESLDNFCQTVINRFALSDINDEVKRIARNPETKFSKNERFEYPLRVLIENNENIDTFKQVFEIILDESFEDVEGFSSFKNSVLNKGKTNIYNEYWEVKNNISAFQKKLGA